MSIKVRSKEHVSLYARMMILDLTFDGLESRKFRKRLGSVVENAVSSKLLSTESNTVVLVSSEDPPP